MADFDINAIDAHFIADPYPTLRVLREQDPVHENPDGSIFLTRHADVNAVYRSRAMLSDKRQAFGEKFGDTPLYHHHTTSLVFRDPPDHTIVRKLLAGAFTPRKLAEMQPLIEASVTQLLDRLEDLQRFDFIRAFAMALPTEIISFMLGIPPAHRHKLRDFSLAILGALDPVVPADKLAQGNAAVEELTALLRELVGFRRAHPEAAGQG